MNNQNLVSIIMPSYNAAHYISKSIESVLAQSYENWELLIVNDASTDKTLQIANSFRLVNARIHVFDLSENMGVSGARNEALKEAKGKYIAFLDSDDLWLPKKLEKQIDFMTRQGVSVCYSWYERMDESGYVLGLVKPPPFVTYDDLLKSNFIGNLTGIYDAEQLGKQYLTDFRHEDYVAWLELVKKAGKAAGLQESTARYRVYSGSISSNKLQVMSWQWRIYRENQAIGFTRSCALMMHYFLHALSKRLG